MIDKSAVKVLVVDDEPFMLKLHLRGLTNLGFTSVTTCEGAQRALEAMDSAARPPDLILLDLNMPGMDGVEFMRQLVTRDYLGSLIIISGEDERTLHAAQTLIRAHEITTLGYLRKPVKLGVLAGVLHNWTPRVRPELGKGLGVTDSFRRAYTADELNTAIDSGELANYYQPKVSLTTGDVVGVETLVRWQHPSHGVVLPDQFIATAEAHGMIQRVTRKVLSGALFHARCWREQTGMELSIAINVSMDDLNTLEFADYIAWEVAAAGVKAQDVTLEVTESRLIRDIRIPLEVLTRLRLKRFRLSIDDFGTGHSSLAQLRDIPFDELKIDRSFVRGAGSDETARAIFETSGGLARQLNMSIVAEGVEDRADWDFVRRSDCDIAQGYFIAKPMSFDKLCNWVMEWEARALISA